VLTGEITYGSYMAFSTLAGYFTSPISDFIGLQTSIQEATISMKRLSEILDYETEDQDTEHLNELEEVAGDIEFKNVTFRYGQRQPALKNISFSIPKGKKVALVGSSGSGKSTITKLLLKYYEVEDGEITIDGVNINEYSNDSVRRAVSYVPQAIELFSKSIFDNIRISKPNATMDEVKEAAKKADAHDFIRKLPLQYNTYLEEAGNGLSGGEKQRIALARAFLKDSGLYIMDESTSNLDFATENTIFDMIYNKLSDRSMLIVAHRLSTVRDCDQILVMEQGEIVERGTHDELIEKKGKYYDLWNMQQGIYRKRDEEDSIEDVAPTVEVDEDDEEAMTY
jgi:ATP-binding cassette subfamily B protein